MLSNYMCCESSHLCVAAIRCIAGNELAAFTAFESFLFFFTTIHRCSPVPRSSADNLDAPYTSSNKRLIGLSGLIAFNPYKHSRSFVKLQIFFTMQAFTYLLMTMLKRRKLVAIRASKVSFINVVLTVFVAFRQFITNSFFLCFSCHSASALASHLHGCSRQLLHSPCSCLSVPARSWSKFLGSLSLMLLSTPGLTPCKPCRFQDPCSKVCRPGLRDA